MNKITRQQIVRLSTRDLEALQNDPRVSDFDKDDIADELDMRYQEAHERNGGMGGWR